MVFGTSSFILSADVCDDAGIVDVVDDAAFEQSVLKLDGHFVTTATLSIVCFCFVVLFIPVVRRIHSFDLTTTLGVAVDFVFFLSWANCSHVFGLLIHEHFLESNRSLGSFA